MISFVVALNLEGVQSAVRGDHAKAERSFRSCLTTLLDPTPVEPTSPSDCGPVNRFSPDYYVVASADNGRLLIPVLFDIQAVLQALQPQGQAQITLVISATVTYNLATCRLLLGTSEGEKTNMVAKSADLYERAGRLLARVVAETKRDDPLLALLHTSLVCNLASLGHLLSSSSSASLIRHAFVCLARYSVPEDLNEHAQRACQGLAPCALPGTSFAFQAAGAA